MFGFESELVLEFNDGALVLLDDGLFSPDLVEPELIAVVSAIIRSLLHYGIFGPL